MIIKYLFCSRTSRFLKFYLVFIRSIQFLRKVSGKDYEDTFTKAYGPIESELSTYGLESEFEDITYIIYILLENPEFTTEPIKRPKLRSYEITHVYERNARIQDTYLNTYNSYIPITKDMLIDLQSEGFYEPYDGEEIDSEVLDSDWVDDFVDNIRVI